MSKRKPITYFPSYLIVHWRHKKILTKCFIKNVTPLERRLVSCSRNQVSEIADANADADDNQ